MNSTSRFGLLNASILSLSLILTACSASTKTNNFTPHEDQSPIETRLPFLNASRINQAKEIAKQNAIEAEVASCMQAAGYQYEPVIYEVSDTSSKEASLIGKSLDFAKTYGYGVFTTPGESTVDSGTANNDASSAQVGPAPNDPNQDYVASLDPATQDSYYATLYGSEDGQVLGCYGQASDSVQDVTEGFLGESAVKELLEKIATNNEDLSNEATIVELNDQWSQCMATKGYDFSTPKDAEDSIWGKLKNLDTADESGTWSEPNPDQFEAEKQAELALAVADYLCREENDYNNKAKKYQWSYEEKFITENEDLIKEVEKLYKND